MMLSAKRNSKVLGAQVHSAYLAAQLFHIKMLLKVLCIIQYLSWQGLILLLSHSKDNPEMLAWLRKKYIYPSIINEIINILKQVESLLPQQKDFFFISSTTKTHIRSTRKQCRLTI